jgi:hypothetical protein
VQFSCRKGVILAVHSLQCCCRHIVCFAHFHTQPHATLELVLPDPIAQGINIMAGRYPPLKFFDAPVTFFMFSSLLITVQPFMSSRRMVSGAPYSCRLAGRRWTAAKAPRRVPIFATECFNSHPCNPLAPMSVTPLLLGCFLSP